MRAVIASAILLGCVGVALAQKIPTAYTTQLRTGAESMKTPDGWTFGTLFDVNFKPLTDKNGKIEVSHSTDFTSILKINGKIYFVAQQEAPNPSNTYLWEVTQDAATGKLTNVPGSLRAVNTKSVGGTVYLCSGDDTPWGTHMGGEEWEPDSRTFELSLNSSALNATRDGPEIFEFLQYFNLSMDPTKTTMEQITAVYNPYNYGLQVEVGVDTMGNPTVKKWRTMGRHQTELSYTMPDNKTVYITDDGQSKALNVFYMDKANDLSSGSLHVAKLTQTSAEAGGKFTVKWIKMGQATQAEIEDAVKSGIKFSDMYDYAKFDAAKGCPEGFKSINSGSTNAECLKLKAGKENIAAFLETRRTSAYLGGTTEANKWEGITFDSDNGFIYTAISDVAKGMEDNLGSGKPNNNTFDQGGPNDIKLKYNKCGCVYKMAVDVKTSPMLATTFDALWCGSDMKGNDTNNFCDVNSIANPDNVHYIAGTNTLIVGEDTIGGHQNDAAWLYNLKNGKATRYFATPYGSETTSPYVYTINGWNYFMMVIQHPYGESDQKTISEATNTGEAAYVGYLGPFKTADLAGVTSLDMEPIDMPLGNDRHKVIASNGLILTKGVISDGAISSSTAPKNSAAGVVGSSLMGLMMAALVFLMA